MFYMCFGYVFKRSLMLLFCTGTTKIISKHCTFKGRKKHQKNVAEYYGSMFEDALRSEYAELAFNHIDLQKD